MANNISDDELLKGIVIVFDNRFGGQFSQDPVIHTRSSWAKKIDAYKEQYGVTDDKISEQFTVLPCEKHTVLDELIKQREEQVAREARRDELTRTYTQVIGDRDAPSSRYSKVTRLFNKYVKERHTQLTTTHKGDR